MRPNNLGHLVNDLHQETDKGSVDLLIFLYLSGAFDTIDQAKIGPKLAPESDLVG